MSEPCVSHVVMFLRRTQDNNRLYSEHLHTEAEQSYLEMESAISIAKGGNGGSGRTVHCERRSRPSMSEEEAPPTKMRAKEGSGDKVALNRKPEQLAMTFTLSLSTSHLTFLLL